MKWKSFAPWDAGVVAAEAVAALEAPAALGVPAQALLLVVGSVTDFSGYKNRVLARAFIIFYENLVMNIFGPSASDVISWTISGSIGLSAYH